MNNKEKSIYDFLNKCNIVFNDIQHLDGMLIPREMLISDEKYKDISKNIIELRKIFSSSCMTSLQTNAPGKQKWPLLNLVRQILKAIDYKMTPQRKSNGYTKDGKKKYRRFFMIHKLKTINNASNAVN